MWLWRGNGSAGRFGARVTFDYGWVCLMIGKAGIEDERLGLMRMSIKDDSAEFRIQWINLRL